MIQKCANPECSTEFLYASRGRLFSFDTTSPKEPSRGLSSAIREAGPVHEAVFFWLCDACTPRFTVAYTREQGFHTVALTESVPANQGGHQGPAGLATGRQTQLPEQAGSAEYLCPNCSLLAFATDTTDSERRRMVKSR